MEFNQLQKPLASKAFHLPLSEFKKPICVSQVGFLVFKILIFLLLASGLANAKTWTWELDSAETQELELQLDPYYSALDYIRSLTEEPIPKFNQNNEWGLYQHMFWNVLRPRFGLIEASLNPLPSSSVLIRSRSESFYQNQKSWIEPITTGFPEPWAVSLFFGNIGNLIDSSLKNDSLPFKVTGKIYSGYLVTYGNQHILNGQLIPDHWYELELNLKGSSLSDRKELSLSYRGGYKIHTNIDIKNLMYFGIKRTSVDRDYHGWNPIKNTEIELLAYAEPHRLFRFWRYWDETPNSYRAILGKNWPLGKSGETVFSLGIGFERTLGTGYVGELAQKAEKEWKLIVRPNLKF